VSDRIAFLHEGRLLRYGRLNDLLASTEQVDIVLTSFAPDAEFIGRWGAESAPGVWRVSSSETRRFLEEAWARGAALVSVTPTRGDLTEQFLEWTRGARGEWTRDEAARA
jgi:hypothetical protein